jgi:hypothetical protein
MSMSRDERGRFREDDDYDYEDRGYRRRGSRFSRYDEDDGRGHGRGGWFGDSEGHSEASRRGWERGDHGDSGWYGDPEGHSEASRRGWDNPRHRPSGWFGDSEGHSEAARRGWDNPRHRPSGWFGDPEGHSEASRRGWEEGHRGRSRYSSRYDDDDDDGYRSRRRSFWLQKSPRNSECQRPRQQQPGWISSQRSVGVAWNQCCATGSLYSRSWSERTRGPHIES